MCGILGIMSHRAVNQELYDGLQMLQHRGQDAAGILTTDGSVFHSHKGQGLVRDVFRTRNMRDLLGNFGIAHVRYPTAGNKSSEASEESQPFYVNSPFGIALAHNGNLINVDSLMQNIVNNDLRHINTSSDSELLLNVFAHELESQVFGVILTKENIFNAVSCVHNRVRGAYAVVAMIAGYGMVAFRDPFGIRPLILGERKNQDGTIDYCVASESLALIHLDFKIVRDLKPGEAIFIDFNGNFYAYDCKKNTRLVPCLFEYVYFSRPDSVVNGVSVYQARLDMGMILADKIKEEIKDEPIDVIMPVPDTSRPIALQLAQHLNIPYREGLIKNRYIGRTFIMPGQAVRKRSVKHKLSPVEIEFKDKNVLLVDDSIVRGTTSREIVDMARISGAKKVFMASAAPEVRYPNVYGIDMPSKEELIAHDRTVLEIAQEIGVDGLVFQNLDDLVNVIRKLNPEIDDLDTSCFDGKYVTGGVDFN
ncbi:MAG: amidophosphoribosyltransferase [Neisseriaceae bacterium]|nr:MAG: amidophosphoribosyltransferase [Neisseriaceae bacterium]